MTKEWFTIKSIKRVNAADVRIPECTGAFYSHIACVALYCEPPFKVYCKPTTQFAVMLNKINVEVVVKLLLTKPHLSTKAKVKLNVSTVQWDTTLESDCKRSIGVWEKAPGHFIHQRRASWTLSGGDKEEQETLPRS